MEYEASSSSPFAPVKPRRLTPADVKQENDALLAYKRSLAVPAVDVQTTARGGNGGIPGSKLRWRDEHDHPTADPFKGQPSCSSLSILKSRPPVLRAPAALPVPTRTVQLQRTPLRDETNDGEDLDALLSNLQKDRSDFEQLTITIREYEQIQGRRRCASSVRIAGIAMLVIGLAASAFVANGLLFPPPSAPPPTAPPPTPPPAPPLVPPPSIPTEVLAALPLVGTGTSLALVGTEAVHSWTDELAHLALLAVLLALFGTLGCHIGSRWSTHHFEQAALQNATPNRAMGSQTMSQGFGFAKKLERDRNPAAATAGRAAAARAAAARAVQGRWRQARSSSEANALSVILARSRVLNDMLSGVHAALYNPTTADGVSVSTPDPSRLARRPSSRETINMGTSPPPHFAMRRPSSREIINHGVSTAAHLATHPSREVIMRSGDTGPSPPPKPASRSVGC